MPNVKHLREVKRFQNGQEVLRPYKQYEREREKRPIGDPVPEPCLSTVDTDVRGVQLGTGRSHGSSCVAEPNTEGKTFAVVH